MSSDHHVDCLTDLIASARPASRNPNLLIMVGGGIFLEHPEYVSRVGASLAATDARQAVSLLHHHLDAMAVSKPR
ncbi:MAG: hypothetical protein HC923_12095 [Myxococcales bacterium]|nr:hypothetical protein [Myxococcales bacterium]